MIQELKEVLYQEMLQAQLELVNAINEVPQDTIKIEVLEQSYKSKKQQLELLD